MIAIPAQPYPYPLDPAHTALVVIDMQRDFVEPGGFGETLGNDVSLLAATIAPTRAVLEAARAAGLRVPHDLSVVGFDDVDAAALSTPPLTTVRVPKIQLGACAADLLLRGTAGGGAPEIWQHCEVRCRTELAVRASTRAPMPTRKEKSKPR